MDDIKLENVLKMPKHQQPSENIPVVDKNISFNDFFEQYLLTNQPCIIKNVADEWKSTKHWITKNRTAVNFKYLRNKYSSEEVLTYDCNSKFYNSHKTEKTLFGKYLQYWEEYKENNYSDKDPLLYLKDWHLQNSHPYDNFYSVPIYFKSDWLNEYLIATKRDDYRFVYMGPKRTWTPFHADVFKSYSWSVNIIGKKRWIFLPPGEEQHLKDKFGNLPHEIINIPLNCKHYNIIQEAGDAIFVPSGWYHQVVNLEDTISINQNWLNGCNINLMYLDMQKHLEEVKDEIDDCKGDSDFEEQCQIVLKASYGMDFKEFLHFISWIAETRLNAKPMSNLARFDLKMIKKVLESFMLNKAVKNLGLLNEVESLYMNITNC